MLIDKALEGISKKNRVVVGFDFGNSYSQISFCKADNGMPETVSLVMGEEMYNIPSLLCRRRREDGGFEWALGGVGDENLVEDLVLVAKNDTTVRVGEEEFGALDILEAYIRKSLGLLGIYVGGDDIGAIAFTMRDLDTAVMDKLKAVSAKIFKKNTQVYFLSHEDCFFQYMLHQPEEMWIQDVLLYDYRTDGIKSYVLSMNRKTSPVACFIESDLYANMKMSDIVIKTPEAKESYYKQLDSDFLEIVRRHCEDKIITSVFLLGESFSKEWCRESLKYMCRGRRVFQGNNLFSKGACYGAREKTYPSVLGTSYVYLSDDKLRANVGMTCDKGQTEIYYPILNAGTNWFEVDKSFDVMLVKGNSITLNIVPIDGHVSRTAKISLEGLKVRGNKTNRVNIRFYMENPSAVWIEITDLGFGELFPSTGQVWRECIPVGGE